MFKGHHSSFTQVTANITRALTKNMENYDILQLIVLFIVYELVKYVFGKKDILLNKKKLPQNLTPNRNNSQKFTKTYVEISGLKPLPEEEDDIKSTNFMDYQRTPKGIPELSVMAATYRYRLRNRQLQSKAKRTLQF